MQHEPQIPRIAHFIWSGERLPWVYALAVRAALARGGFERVILHHSENLASDGELRALRSRPGFVPRAIDERAILAATGPYAARLREIFAVLSAPSARANVLRAALLYAEGGVYLDTDAITLTSLRDLCERGGAFVGLEHVAFPASVMQSRRPERWAAALLRTGVRDLLRRLPEGHRTFQRVSHLYPLAVNNAVLASAPRHAFISDLLAQMVALPPSRWRVRFALGTHLLQQVVASYRGAGLHVERPELFYPLGPEISEHWFRVRRASELASVLTPRTRVVHWYASVRSQRLAARMDARYVEARVGRQLFSDLVAPLCRGQLERAAAE